VIAQWGQLDSDGVRKSSSAANRYSSRLKKGQPSWVTTQNVQTQVNLSQHGKYGLWEESRHQSKVPSPTHNRASLGTIQEFAFTHIYLHLKIWWWTYLCRWGEGEHTEGMHICQRKLIRIIDTSTWKHMKSEEAFILKTEGRHIHLCIWIVNTNPGTHVTTLHWTLFSCKIKILKICFAVLMQRGWYEDKFLSFK
jgi:hypothetical protein